MTGPPDLLIVPPDRTSDAQDHATPHARAQLAEDPLGEVLSSVRLTGALFFVADATSPWCIEVPHIRHFAGTVMPHAQHLLSYHIAVEGGGFASIPGVAPIAYEEGDILLFAHGDGYKMQNAIDTPPEFSFEETLDFMRLLADGSLPFVVPEGGGGLPKSKTICGFLGCDTRPFNPVLVGLPRMLCLRRRRNEGRDMLDQLITLAVDEAQSGRPGSKSVHLRLSELMFIELLRRYIDAPGDKPPGWLAALQDTAVAKALAGIHARPEEDWTVDSLAQAAGVSRSTLAQRFTDKVGKPPLRYLMLWRMQTASRLLQEDGLPISEVGRRVGYGAEPAFSRRFRSVTGVTPTEWRASRRRA
jgi:AraC-like DNA-binding protein